MKITDVKLRFAKHYLFVQVYTDAGIVGLGEAGNWGYLQATAAAIEKFADYLIGKDPFRIEDFNQNFLRSVYFRGSVIMSAISAIDIALWDIKGKMANMPVYELLGGKLTKKGVIISVVIMIVMTYVGDRVAWAIMIARELETDVFYGYRLLPLLLSEEVIDMTSYVLELVLLYALLLVGAIPTIQNAMRKDKVAGTIGKL